MNLQKKNLQKKQKKYFVLLGEYFVMGFVRKIYFKFPLVLNES